MATLNTQSFATIVQQFAAGAQARATELIDFAVGAILRATAEAYAGIAEWLQALIVQVLAVTRLTTSFGSDVDSFVGDWGIVTRLGAEAATGLVTLSRFTASPSAPFIAVGAQVKTADGSQTFSVTADPTNTAYSAALNGYTMAAGVTSLQVPVQAVNAGTQGNVSAGSISLIASQITGIDTVTNLAAFTNGIDQEQDSSLKARFQAAILGLSRGDLYGTDAAIEATGVSVQFTVTEGSNYDGSYHPGYYFIVADDGSGAPPSAFMAAVSAAVQSVRPLGIMVGVFPPTIAYVKVSMITTTAPGYNHAVVVSQVSAALAAYINGLGLGNGLPYFELAAVALGVAGVTNVSALLLNNGSADIAASNKTTIKAGTLLIS